MRIWAKAGSVRKVTPNFRPELENRIYVDLVAEAEEEQVKEVIEKWATYYCPYNIYEMISEISSNMCTRARYKHFLATEDTFWIWAIKIMIYELRSRKYSIHTAQKMIREDLKKMVEYEMEEWKYVGRGIFVETLSKTIQKNPKEIWTGKTALDRFGVVPKRNFKFREKDEVKKLQYYTVRKGWRLPEIKETLKKVEEEAQLMAQRLLGFNPEGLELEVVTTSLTQESLTKILNANILDKFKVVPKQKSTKKTWVLTCDREVLITAATRQNGGNSACFGYQAGYESTAAQMAFDPRMWVMRNETAGAFQIIYIDENNLGVYGGTYTGGSINDAVYMLKAIWNQITNQKGELAFGRRELMILSQEEQETAGTVETPKNMNGIVLRDPKVYPIGYTEILKTVRMGEKTEPLTEPKVITADKIKEFWHIIISTDLDKEEQK